MCLALYHTVSFNVISYQIISNLILPRFVFYLLYFYQLQSTILILMHFLSDISLCFRNSIRTPLELNNVCCAFGIFKRRLFGRHFFLFISLYQYKEGCTECICTDSFYCLEELFLIRNLLFIFFLKEVANADIVLKRIFPQHMMTKMMSNHFTLSRNCPEWNCASTALCNEIEYFPIIWSAPTIDDQQWQLRRDNKLLRLLTMSILFCSCAFWTLLQMCN